MTFYTYRQNNSGGSFIINDTLTVNVIIEAPSPRMADAKMEDLGADFSRGYDCSCCGNRWDTARGEGDDTPLIYGSPPEEYLTQPYTTLWAPPGRNVVIYYLNGETKWL